MTQKRHLCKILALQIADISESDIRILQECLASAVNRCKLEHLNQSSRWICIILVKHGESLSHSVIQLIWEFKMTLVDRKFNSCKILQDSSKKSSILARFLDAMAFLQDSCKILARNCALSRRKILQDSCKILARICDLSRESCKILQEINHLYTHYVLIIYAFHQKPSRINRYRKIFDELYNCWTHFVIEHL